MATENIILSNHLWEVEISPALHGRVVRLVDRASGATRVQAPQLAEGAIAEGGHMPFFGLELWTKSGNEPDFNTAVLSAFAPVHGKPLAVEHGADFARLTARHAGLTLTLEWRLPAGDAPLSCRATVANESAPVDNFQFEGFFLWTAPATTWIGTATVVPGLAPVAFPPYGEIIFKAGDHANDCAAWWSRGMTDGVALRAVEGTDKYFFGIQGYKFALGPHSVARRLAPGDALSFAFEIAPLAYAQAQGWPLDIPAQEAQLLEQERQTRETVARIGGLAGWTTPAEPSPITRRAFHMTVQYAPVELRATLDLLERIVAPAGYNQLMVEVDRAFPYRSHPNVAVPWAWTRAQWMEFAGAAKSLGFELIPQYNALAHQGEAGLATAYPELWEDEKGWCLCPQHPKTQPYLCELFDELIEVFDSSIFHIGLDEIDMPSRPQSYRVCPRCREADGGAIFADHICALHRHLAARGQEVMMWADMLLHRPEHNSVNGLRTGIWRAIERLPRDIIMIDWVYSPVNDYGGSRYLLDQGFRVMGATWHTTPAIANFARFAVEQQLYGMCQTTWSDPNMHDWPMVCVLLAGKYFQQPFIDDLAGTVAEAKGLAAVLINAPVR